MDTYTYKVFEQYKNKFEYNYHGVNLNSVMVFELWFLFVQRKLWYKINNFYLFKALNFKNMNVSKPLLTTFGRQNRKDHKEVYDFAYNEVADIASYNDLNQVGFKPVFHPKIIISTFKYVFLNEIFHKVRFAEKVKFYFALNYYTNTILELEKTDMHLVRKYLSMYNFAQEENLITQFLKYKNIKTYSLCEGVYFDQGKDAGIDACTYRNMETSHLLVWGQYTVDEMIKAGLDNKSIFACGYPHSVNRVKVNENKICNRGLVLLARKNVEKSNDLLMEILKKKSGRYKFSLKLHPTLDYTKYKQLSEKYNMEIIPKDKTLSECLSQVYFDFSIAVNTSAYYESLMAGIPCLRFNDNSFLLMYGMDDIFEDCDGFEKKLNKISSMQLSKLQSLIDNTINYVLGVGINRYREILS